ncbi:hypothetical protein [Methanocella arvoryzae]|nr:hypothetical protein [Methanocella arvoryzae]
MEDHIAPDGSGLTCKCGEPLKEGRCPGCGMAPDDCKCQHK